MRSLRTSLINTRLMLRCPQASDVSDLHQAYFSDPECARFLQRTAFKDQEQSAALLTRLGAALLENGEGMFGWVIAVGQPGVPVGLITCIAEGHVVQIHYGLAKSHWGKGLATEAVKLAVDELLDCGRFDRVCTTCAAEHVASCSVLTKCGFEVECALPQALLLPALGNSRRDGVCYRIDRT